MLIVQPDKDPMFRVNGAFELLIVAKVLAIDEAWEGNSGGDWLSSLLIV